MSRSERCPGARKTTAMLVVISVVIGACASDQDEVCQDIGNCAENGSNDWIVGCKQNAEDLRTEASGAGCAGALDAWFSCAESAFRCDGNVVSFPGCEAKRKSLDDCLAAGRSRTSCVVLEAATRVCASSPSAAAPVPTACTASRQCQSKCFLDTVANVCAPRVDELSAFKDCASRCPT